MSTLYELTEDYLRLLELLEEEDYLDPQIFADTLEGIEGEFETKADGYARVIQELPVEAEKYEKAQQRMEAIQKNDGVQPMTLVPDVEIPEEYYKKEPDSAKIREALQKGETLPFAVLRERGEHLVIR